jgi:uncharacterized protein
MPDEWILPAITEHNRSFFTSGELRIQVCRDCGAEQHPPGEICHACQGFSFDYVRVRPRGVIDSYTIVHHPIHSLLSLVVPYNVVVVALDDNKNVRILGNVIDAAPSDIAIGLPVIGTWAEVVDEPAGETYRLLQWRLADQSSAAVDRQ